MPEKRKILFVSYQLPPYGGIGGRRWAKFGKYLVERGYDIQFLTPRVENRGNKRWEADYEIIKDRISFFESKYPSIIRNTPKTFTQKLAYRFALGRLKDLEKGNYFDPSCMDKVPLQKVVLTKIKEGFSTVISTGAPFLQLFHLAELKKSQASFKLIVDLRDPWTMQNWSYGFQSLSVERIAIEKEREKFVMEQADKVITVSPRMTQDLSEIVEDKRKFHTVYNGYDPVENVKITSQVKNKEKIKFIFAGNYYNDSVHHIRGLLDALQKIKLSNRSLYSKLQFDFYGFAPASFHEAIKNEPSITHLGLTPTESVSEKIQNADVAMLFLIDKLNYSFSTKFFEYIALDKPILMFAKAGDSSKFISENKIGWHFQQELFEGVLKDIQDRKEKNSLSIAQNFNKERFSLPSLTDQIERIISELN